MSFSLKNKKTGWYLFAVSAICAVLFLIVYLLRGGDIFTAIHPAAVILTVAGVLLSAFLLYKDIKPLEILPFLLFFAALLVFFATEIEFIGNVFYGTDGQAFTASFIAIVVFGLAAVVTGMISALKGID
jgi:hypothetical protein